MKEYTFCIAIGEGCPGFFVPRELWADNGIDIDWSGVICVTLKAETWDTASAPSYEGAPELLDFFQDWLRAAYCLHGYLLDPRRYSPQQLHEALSAWEHPWKVEPGAEQSASVLTDSDLDADGYGEMSLGA